MQLHTREAMVLCSRVLFLYAAHMHRVTCSLQEKPVMMMLVSELVQRT